MTDGEEERLRIAEQDIVRIEAGYGAALATLSASISRIETKLDRLNGNGTRRAWADRGLVGVGGLGGGAGLLVVLERMFGA